MGVGVTGEGRATVGLSPPKSHSQDEFRVLSWAAHSLASLGEASWLGGGQGYGVWCVGCGGQGVADYLPACWLADCSCRQMCI